MANLLSSLRRRPSSGERSSPFPALSMGAWAQMFGYGGLDYGFIPGQTLGGNREEIGGDFRGYVEGALKSNGVVFACMLARMLLFSEARFQYLQIRSGRPGDLFGNQGLRTLEKPWPNGTTGDLLARMLFDADLAGNAYIARRSNNRLRRLRPDWVTIIMGSDTRPDPDATIDDLDVEVLGYAYQSGGPQSGRDPQILLAEEVAHFAPIPDPTAIFRGMSWLTPVLREVLSDGAATAHKLQFFENGATPNMVVSLDPSVKPDQLERFKAIFSSHEGIAGAYETMFLGGGADVKVVGADFKQLDFKVTQGHGETRIAAAAGVPPVIVGLSEGLEAATYSNYGQARRRFADGTMRPLWRNAAGSLSSLVPVPNGAELWYDDRDIPFLQEDLKDAAEIQTTAATTMKTLIEAGFEPDEVVSAVTAGDLHRLAGKHTGLVSVQLQPPGTPADGGGTGDDTPPPADPQSGRALLEAHVNGHRA